MQRSLWFDVEGDLQVVPLNIMELHLCVFLGTEYVIGRGKT